MIFKIYFEQVNQAVYEIEAESEEEAIKKAKRDWNQVYRDPEPSYIEKMEARR